MLIYSLILLIGLTFLIRYIRDNKLSYTDKVKMIKKQFVNFDKNKKVAKNGGHLFGLPIYNNVNRIDLKKLNKIIEVNYDEKYAIVEGSVYVKDLSDRLLRNNWVIMTPPDMVHLTFSGLIAGVGGGSTSFRHGFFHESILEMDVLTGEGKIIKCSPEEHSDLFYAIPNSLGTLGYILRIKMRIKPGKPFVKVTYERYTDSEEYFKKLDEYCGDTTIDFLDGTILGPNILVLVIGKFEVFVPEGKERFDKTKIFWKQLEKNEITEQYFTLYDYIWRWDSDMYYTTMETPDWTSNGDLRKYIPRELLKSTVYRTIAQLIRFDHKALDCNDVFIPIARANEFFQWFKESYKLYPIYICPVRCKTAFSLWDTCYFCDFGVGYGVNLKERPKDIDMELEKKIMEFEGRKLLYAPVHCSPEIFWKLTNIDENVYNSLKDRYDPEGRFMTLYQKIKK